MSFSDLMSSARGPGVIGMLLALVVIVGFGTLYMFAFEDGGKLEKSLAAIIRDDAKEIVRQKASIIQGEEKLDNIPELKRISARVEELVAQNKSAVVRISERKAEIASLESALESLDAKFEDYKNEYRAFARNGAEGTKMDELKTQSGEIYRDVDIRKVTAVGIEIRHTDGHKRIGFEELPDEMQDHYQFDKNQMLAEVQREAKVRKKHDSAVAAANEAADEMAAERAVRDAVLLKEKTVLAIAAKQAQIQSVAGEIRQLESDIVSAENAAASARAAGRMHLSKAGNIRNKLSAKRTQYNNLQSDLARLRASL